MHPVRVSNSAFGIYEMESAAAETRKRVLIAEDHADTAEMTCELLKMLDYDVSLALNGLQAITIARARIPHAILLDIGLPFVDGFEVAKELRGHPELDETVLIGCSGHNSPEYWERAREAGFDYYVPKPTDPKILFACLDPEQYTTTIEKNIIAESASLQLRSMELQFRAHALSVRTVAVVRRAQELCRKGIERRCAESEKSPSPRR
jgi:CheY-like chemotaxis protein